MAVAVPALLLAWPVLSAAAILVWLVDRRPVFLGQQREGLDGRPFGMWKLRTMYLGADRILEAHLAGDERAQAEWATYGRLRDDPRVLPVVGRLARRYSIDELPQLWNVVRGQMSVVGPRPVAGEHLTFLRPRYRRIRTAMRPGMTGLWQVSGRSELGLARMEVMDVVYVRRWSLALDLWILWRTVPAVISARGAY